MSSDTFVCGVCSSWFRRLFEGNSSSIQSFNGVCAAHRAGMKENCLICTRIWWQLEDDYSKGFRGTGIVSISSDGYSCRAKHILQEVAFGGLAKWGIMRYGLAAFESNQHLLSAPELSPCTSSKQTLEQARHWLASCQESHSCAGLGRIPGYCPTRLIDIGTTDDGNWKLYEGTDNPPAYLTLSHRWGPFQPLKLERSSLADFRRGMPVSELPKTFRDAITIARYLSIRYLWIDSLCIIQDSPDDWQNEASRMCGVYANSVCNISAGDSTASKQHHNMWDRWPLWGAVSKLARSPHNMAGRDYEGLFRTRDPAMLRPFELQERESNKRLICWADHALDEEVLLSPLYSRGWVLQERLLAPRTIHFGKNQVFWLCSSLRASESLPQGGYGTDPLDLELLRDITPIEASVAAPTEGSVSTSSKPVMPVVALGLWFNIVSAYSSCDLTVPGDKQIALSGITKLFQNITGDECLDGLWRSRFCECLCWRVGRDKEGNPVGRKPQQRRAPSWSWASMDGQIDYETNEIRFSRWYNEDLRTLATLVRIDTVATAESTSLASQASSARAIVSCVAAPVILTKKGGLVGWCIGSSSGTLVPRSYVDPEIFLDISNNAVEKFQEVYFLVLRSSMEYTLGLVLEKVSGPDEVYRRLGFFNANCDNSRAICKEIGIISDPASGGAKLASTAQIRAITLI